MSKKFDIQEVALIHRYYDFPDWVTPELLDDIRKSMSNNVEFRNAVLYRLLECNKDSQTCSDLEKFFDSYVYGYDTLS